MSSQPYSDSGARRSKQQASKNIAEQSRKRVYSAEEASSSTIIFPMSVYGTNEILRDSPVPPIVAARETIINGLLKNVSEMYFGSTEPYAEILRCMDDRIDENTGKYVSGLESLLKSEAMESNTGRSKASKEKIIVTPLDMLACPFRRPEALDQWAPIDITLFELSICESKGFHPKKIAGNFEGRKSFDEILSFFENVYSKSDNWIKIQKILKHEALSVEGYETPKSDLDTNMDQTGSVLES